MVLRLNEGYTVGIRSCEAVGADGLVAERADDSWFVCLRQIVIMRVGGANY